MYNDLISIIIPIYNSEKYLIRCINSIINQTYYNLEIILINDGSTDNSLKICEDFQCIDKRIFVINQWNRGASKARNAGIAIAHGNYIGFVDSDDYINIRMYEILHNMIVRYQCDVSECGYSKVDNNGKLVAAIHMDDEIVNGIYNCAKANIMHNNTSEFIWNKLFSIKCLGEQKFKNYHYSEDYLFLSEFFLKCNVKATTSKCLYYHVYNENSLCNQKISEKYMDILYAGERVFKIYSLNMRSLNAYPAFYIADFSIQLYYKIKYSNIDNKYMLLCAIKNIFKHYYAYTPKLYSKFNFLKLHYWLVYIFNIEPDIISNIYRICKK